MSGGKYYRAIDRESLVGVYAELDKLSTREIETVSHRPVTDLFHWPLAAGLLLTLAAAMAPALAAVRRRSLSRPNANPELADPA